jgi:hypothetical protein
MTDKELIEQLGILKREFFATQSALNWQNPSNTRTPDKFVEAYVKLQDHFYENTRKEAWQPTKS